MAGCASHIDAGAPGRSAAMNPTGHAGEVGVLLRTAPRRDDDGVKPTVSHDSDVEAMLARYAAIPRAQRWTPSRPTTRLAGGRSRKVQRQIDWHGDDHTALDPPRPQPSMLAAS